MGHGLIASAVFMLAVSVLAAGAVVAQALERFACREVSVHLVDPEAEQEAPPQVLRL